MISSTIEWWLDRYIHRILSGNLVTDRVYGPVRAELRIDSDRVLQIREAVHESHGHRVVAR